MGVCYPIFPAVLEKIKTFFFPAVFSFYDPWLFPLPLARSLFLSLSLSRFFFLIYQLTIYVLGPEQQLNYSFYDRFAGLSSSPGRTYKYIYICVRARYYTRPMYVCVCECVHAAPRPPTARHGITASRPCISFIFLNYTSKRKKCTHTHPHMIHTLYRCGRLKR